MPPSQKDINGYTNHLTAVPAANGHAINPKGRRDVSLDTASLAIRDRASKKTERDKRGGRAEGGIELVSPTLSTSTSGI